MVMNGLVDFSLTNQAGKVAFYTADGQYTVGDPMFNASTEGAVRGYMQIADDGRAKIGLHEGRWSSAQAKAPKQSIAKTTSCLLKLVRLVPQLQQAQQVVAVRPVLQLQLLQAQEAQA